MIAAIIGISYDLFTTLYTFDGDSSFFKRETAEQKLLLEEIFQIQILSEVGGNIKDKAKQITKDLEIMQNSVTERTNTFDRLQISIANNNTKLSEWQENYDYELDSLREKIATAPKLEDIEKDELAVANNNLLLDNISLLDNEIQYDLALEDIQLQSDQWYTKVSDSIKETEVKMSQYDIIAIKEALESHVTNDVMISSIQTMRYELKSLDKDIKNIHSNLTNLDSELVNLELSKCPKCNSKLTDDKLKITTTNSIAEYTSQLKELTTEATTLQLKLNDTEISISEFLDENPSKIELIDLLADFDRLEANLKHSQKELSNNPHTAQLVKFESRRNNSTNKHLTINEKYVLKNKLAGEYEAGLQYLPSINELITAKNEIEFNNRTLAKLLREYTNPYVDIIQDLNRQIEELNLGKLIDDADQMAYLKQHYVLLQSLFLNKDSSLRTFIINKFISNINSYLLDFTKRLGLPHICQITPDLDVLITNDGFDYSYGNLSAGELQRLNLAITFALNRFHSHKNSISILFCDEIDNHLDEAGCYALYKTLQFLEHQSISLYIVSHNATLKDKITNIVLVEKTNGFSEISYGVQ